MKVVEVNNEIDLVQSSSNNHSNISINIDHVHNITVIKMDKVDEVETDLLVDLEANQLERNQLNSNDGSNSIVAIVSDVVAVGRLENNLPNNFSDNFDGKSNKNTSIQLEDNLERSISNYQLKMLDKVYALYEGENKIGRAASNTIFVDNQFVSRNHATINVDGDSLTIIDYSKNGTFVNGCKIFQPTQLSINDTISITKGYKYELVQNDIAKDPLVKGDIVKSHVVNDELVEADVIKSEPAKSVENELVISGLVAETELVQRLSRFNSLSSRLGSSGSNSNRFRVNAGFSLIELLIVIVIIGIIAAISVPNLLTTKRSANSASAIQTLRLISSSQASYSAGVGNGEYANVDDLVREQFIDSGIGAASIPSSSTNQQPKSGYIFVFNKISANPATNTLPSYEVSARPLFTNSLTASGNKSFFVDASAVIRVSPMPSAPFADANSQPLN